MEIESRYRQAVIADHGESIAKRALTEVVDDLIRLAPNPEYVAHLQRSYDKFLTRRTQTLADEWIAEGLPSLFLTAARAAAGRHLDARLAPHLARVTFEPGGPDEIKPGDLPALGAWCLLELVRTQTIAVATECDSCRLPFVLVRGSGVRYCNRPAPGKDGSWLTRSCRDVERERTFFESRAAFRREYRNVHERVNSTRTVPDAAFALWKAEFGPKGPEAANPQRFDTWIELQLTARARKAARLVEEHQRSKGADDESK